MSEKKFAEQQNQNEQIRYNCCISLDKQLETQSPEKREVFIKNVRFRGVGIVIAGIGTMIGIGAGLYGTMGILSIFVGVGAGSGLLITGVRNIQWANKEFVVA